MTAPVVAKIWWEAPHAGVLERFMVSTDVVTFGRSGECSIQVGHAPIYDPTVPRIWGELSWHRGTVLVTNRSSTWGLSLVPVDDGVRIPVHPGAVASSPAARFQILAQAPEVEVTLSVLTAPQRAGAPAYDDGTAPPSFVPFTLTPTQKLIGAAVVAPLASGHPRRASYAEIVKQTHYAPRTVREAVAAMDGLFILHRLAEPSSASDALDRVAQTLRLHTALLGGER